MTAPRSVNSSIEVAVDPATRANPSLFERMIMADDLRLRRRLDDSDLTELPLLQEFRDKGGTDYLALQSRFGAALGLMTEIQAVCYVKETRDLQTLSECTLLKPAPDLAHSLERLSFGSAACELVDRLTIEGEGNPRLYQCLAGVLHGLAEVESAQVESLFWYFQLRAAAALGYRPQLRQCVSCQRDLSDTESWFSAALGGGLCADCGPGNGVRLAPRNWHFLATLQGLRTYSKEVLPPAPPQRGEIRLALRGFLEYHGGQHSRLKSLDFLDGLKRAVLSA